MGLEMMVATILAPTFHCEITTGPRCTHCGEKKSTESFYLRKSNTFHANGTKCGSVGAVLQPCKECMKLKRKEYNERKSS